MKKLVSCLFIGLSFAGLSQVKWQIEPTTDLGFAENIGRYNDVLGEEILFHAEYGNQTYFISNNAIIIGEREQFSQEEIHEYKEAIEHGETPSQPAWNYFKIEFDGANLNAKVEAKGQKEHTWNFQDPLNTQETKVARTYDLLKITDLYPGIDLLMELPNRGLKYSFEVSPGANYTNIQMIYQGATAKIDAKGELLLTSEVEDYKDMKPYCFVETASGKSEVKSAFTLEDNQVIFELEDYNENEKLIIDPWLVPALSFTTVQKAIEVGYDDSGNCYIMGNSGGEVAMYDNTGTFQWLWTGPIPGFLEGDLTTRPSSNECYFTYTAAQAPDPTVFRFNDVGVVTASYLLSTNPTDPSEIWRITYDEFYDRIVLGTGGVFADAQVMLMDLGLTTNSNYSAYTSGLSAEDVVYIRADKDGNGIYYLISTVPNHLSKVDEVDPAVILWDNITTGHTFAEAMSVQYTGGGFIVTNGFNGMVQSENFLYSYDGNLVNQYDFGTGALTNSLNLGVAPYFSGGIAADPCGNIYIGLTDSIRIYDESFNYQGGFDTPDAVYDLEVGNGNLYVSGENFVMEIELSAGGLSMNSTGVACSACTGTAVVDTVGCPGFFVDDILWSPGGATTDSIFNLCAGWYTSTVTWINGLGDTIVGTDSVEVISTGSNINVTEAFANVSCSGACDGTIDLTPTSGTPPYTFDIGTQNNTTGSFTGLCEGNFNITVTDDIGCDYTSVIVIGAGSGNITVTEAFTDETCPGSCDGTITLTATSGTSPFVYDVGTFTNGTGNFSGLCAGNFAITVTDDNGCDYTSNINIGTIGGLGLDTVSTNRPTCYGFNDGSITVAATGGVPPITYTWTPTNPIPGATFNNLTAGTYTVVAIDNSGGCQDSISITLTQPDSIFADLTIIDPLCYDDLTGIAEVDTVFNAQGNLNNISFFWNPNPGNQSGVGADSTGNMGQGTYTLTINDDNGCSSLQDFIITEPDSLYFSQLGSEPAYCRLFGFQSGNGVVFAAGSGGTPDYTYEWTNIASLQTSNNSTWGGLNPGDFQIVITDNNGCVLSQILTMDSLNPIAAFTVVSPQLDANCEGTEIVNAVFTNQSQYFANPNNPQADTTFFWNLNHDNTGWYLSHDINELIDTSYAGEFTYQVCLVVINKNECSDTACKDIIVHAQPELIPPNIFTPNGGTENEVFTFEYYATAIVEFKCVIVNRWGVQVAELNSITSSWDGTDTNGSNSPEGVYFYTYEAVSTNGTAFDGQGTVQLVRGN